MPRRNSSIEMDCWNLLNLLFNLLTFINCILTILICLTVFGLILVFHRRSRSVPLLLASHTCSILLISALMLASMSMASLLGFAGITLQQHGETNWCRWRGFFIHGFLCALYDSYTLQAGFRLCRVVFYRHRRLYSYSLYLFLISVKTLFGVVSISPVLLRGDVVYLSSEFYCQTPFTNIPAISYIALRLFLFPLLFITLTYVCLVKHVRKGKSISIKKDIRDLIVIKRLLMMLAVLILLGLPSVIFLVILIVTGHLLLVTYRLGWLSVSFSLVFLAYMIVQLTHPLKKTVKSLCIRHSIG